MKELIYTDDVYDILEFSLLKYGIKNNEIEEIMITLNKEIYLNLNNQDDILEAWDIIDFSDNPIKWNNFFIDLILSFFKITLENKQ